MLRFERGGAWLKVVGMIAAGQAMWSGLFGMKAEQRMWGNGDQFAARYKSSSSICFAEVLAMLLLRGYRKPPHSIVCLCRCSRSQCGTWRYGDIQKVVLLTILRKPAVKLG